MENAQETMRYPFYKEVEGTRWNVNVIYADSRAALARMTEEASQTILPKVIKISRITKLNIYGNPSQELQQALERASPKPTIYSLVMGFDRS